MFMADLKKIDPEGYDELKAQDEQLAEIQAAEAKYEDDKNLDELISFWEQIWSSGGLKFAGSHWAFRLPDLYIKAKKYDEALSLVHQIKKKQKTYAVKAGSYIAKIEERKAKAVAKKKA